ncbi:hypothetical protein GCM10023172_18090 [Hymenobacter ginsengisoli]|uniref:STAS/SEC14 domain-containing protein n=1 Tax=Hymenobacter ginsengisoli TaxID=1051626 RepID=A0ABP8Q9E0_9BACT|nr:MULTISPECIES: hypothetical protein [unclassified Hymenobacter]MBO2031631.1 hypothetical protein [Hymenobacter sp. BT559]
MNLQLLCTAPQVTIYFDSWNNWLYIEWEGTLTLPAVQYACLEVAQCFVQHSYPRVLNSNAQVTSMEVEVIPWLTKHLLPYLEMAGIQQLAWVHAPIVRAYALAPQVHKQLPHLNIGVFSDLEDATSWLQQTNPAYLGGHVLLPRPAAEETVLAQTVSQFRQALEHHGIVAETAIYQSRW